MKSYIIRIELEGSNPLIWRKVIMPAGATYNRLHDIIQNVTNFKSGYPYGDYHLYEFDLSFENRVVTNCEESYEEHKFYKKNKKMFEQRLKNTPDKLLGFEQNHQNRLKKEVRKPAGLKIDDYLETYKTIEYKYDFGENWTFKIKLEEIVEDYYFGYPTVLDGAETAPPEDVGGIHAFYDFLDIYHDETHPDHIETVNWANSLYYKAYDKDGLSKNIKCLSYKKTEWHKIHHKNYKVIQDKYMRI